MAPISLFTENWLSTNELVVNVWNVSSLKQQKNSQVNQKIVNSKRTEDLIFINRLSKKAI
ncbi:hypothetical protein RIVM261_037370 [Rivularia sp. IAM M-261]|nr:hypothetical protein CAL7716_076380 [Calothrix sp. PCC 7716]GJD18781.1 hypothetical protein RIVM261_037370 [Rivularia sp. IAM M-261]